MEFIRRTEFSDPLDGLLAFHALAKAIREEFPSEAIFDGEGVAFTIDECEIWLTMGLEVLNYDAETGQSQVQTVRPTVILARGKEGILSRFLSSTGSRWDELPPQMPIVDGVDRDFVSLTASVEGQLEGLTLMTEILKRIDENDLWRILEHELRYVDDHTAPQTVVELTGDSLTLDGTGRRISAPVGDGSVELQLDSSRVVLICSALHRRKLSNHIPRLRPLSIEELEGDD